MTFQIGRGTRNGCRSAVAKGQTDTSDVVHLLDGLQVRTSDEQARGERLQRFGMYRGGYPNGGCVGGAPDKPEDVGSQWGREVRTPGM